MLAVPYFTPSTLPAFTSIDVAVLVFFRGSFGDDPGPLKHLTRFFPDEYVARNFPALTSIPPPPSLHPLRACVCVCSSCAPCGELALGGVWCFLCLVGRSVRDWLVGPVTAPQSGVTVYSAYTSFAHLAAGMACGLRCVHYHIGIICAGRAALHPCLE